ncbi:hypothetical protein HDV00_005999 [Rhizophlyctis rosea]|nr:hypothetical protein HDV00_005999 [Rhizophlyctis rosea]
MAEMADVLESRAGMIRDMGQRLVDAQEEKAALKTEKAELETANDGLAKNVAGLERVNVAKDHHLVKSHEREVELEGKVKVLEEELQKLKIAFGAISSAVKKVEGGGL